MALLRGPDFCENFPGLCYRMERVGAHWIAVSGEVPCLLGATGLNSAPSMQSRGTVGAVISGPPTGGSPFREKHLAGMRYEPIAIAASFGSSSDTVGSGAILQRQCTAVRAHVDIKMKTKELRSRERRMKRVGRKESSCRPWRRWPLLPPPAAASSVRSRSSIN